LKLEIWDVLPTENCQGDVCERKKCNAECDVKTIMVDKTPTAFVHASTLFAVFPDGLGDVGCFEGCKVTEGESHVKFANRRRLDIGFAETELVTRPANEDQSTATGLMCLKAVFTGEGTLASVARLGFHRE